MNWGIPFQLPDRLLISGWIHNASEGPLPEKLNFLKINSEDGILYASTAVLRVLRVTMRDLSMSWFRYTLSSPLLLYSFQYF